MKLNVFQKICRSHGLNFEDGELSIFPDQVLIHDGTGTPVYLQLEAVGIQRIKPFTVTYVDHNTLLAGYQNADDHRYLKGMSRKLGSIFSKLGNGICHQIHLENFGKPGQILFGSDSHTPMAGGIGMFGIGAGGLDAAAVMVGEPFFLKTPKIVGVRLEGELPAWSSGKDVILHLLHEVSVKGGVGSVFEFFGPGVSTLTVFDRATICNMGTETGATSSLFPSDRQTYRFLKSFGREDDWQELTADEHAEYDETLIVDLSSIEPMVAMPHSPDQVKKVSEVERIPVTQVAIGSCTNSSFKDLAIAATILKGKTVHPDVNLIVSPGSRRTLSKITETGMLETFIHAGARILENTCGPCNGVGQSPERGGHSIRTHNRNFKGRSGTLDASVYLASPETAAASALTGCISDPRKTGNYPSISLPEAFPVHPDMFIPPAADTEDVTISKGPNIQPMPLGTPLSNRMHTSVELKTGDDVTTDHILPGGAHMLALRSNIPASVPYVFNRIDADFASRVDALPEQWAIVAGENYGQGSSREHAVMVPMSIGLKLVVAKSFARIYRQNLINFGVLPLVFQDPEDYHIIDKADVLVLENVMGQIENNNLGVFNKTKDYMFITQCDFSAREKKLLEQGGLLNYLRLKH